MYPKARGAFTKRNLGSTCLRYHKLLPSVLNANSMSHSINIAKWIAENTRALLETTTLLATTRNQTFYRNGKTLLAQGSESDALHWHQPIVGDCCEHKPACTGSYTPGGATGKPLLYNPGHITGAAYHRMAGTFVSHFFDSCPNRYQH